MFMNRLSMQEILRIREEHPDDDRCIVNGRVKGRLKVTRAFGAGYLKHVCFSLVNWFYYFTVGGFIIHVRIT